MQINNILYHIKHF